MLRDQISRRDWLRLSSAGVLGTSVSGWFGLLADRASSAAQQGTKHKSCILLWMAGGPAQSHTFDLKPGSEYKAIKTATDDLQKASHAMAEALYKTNEPKADAPKADDNSVKDGEVVDAEFAETK